MPGLWLPNKLADFSAGVPKLIDGPLKTTGAGVVVFPGCWRFLWIHGYRIKGFRRLYMTGGVQKELVRL